MVKLIIAGVLILAAFVGGGMVESKNQAVSKAVKKAIEVIKGIVNFVSKIVRGVGDFIKGLKK